MKHFLAFICLVFFPTSALAAYNASSFTTPGGVGITVPYPSLPYATPEAFGALGDGSHDDTSAWQAAINTGYTVVGGSANKVANYKITSTLRFKARGQIIECSGYGYHNTAGPCTLTWGGSNGGKIISFASTAGVAMVEDAQLRDMNIDGAGTAGECVEGYDSTISGGAWRNRVENVFCLNGNGSSTGVELGTNSGVNDANDFTWSGGGFYGWTTCADGAGATLSFVDKVTFQGCSTTGINARAGSYWTFSNDIFSTNGWDITATNTQGISITGTWFENSSNGIYTATTAQTLNITGSYLQTASSTLINLNGAAGNVSIKGSFIPNSSSSSLMAGLNPSYTYDVCTSGVALQGKGGTCFVQPNNGLVFSNTSMTNGGTLVLPVGRGTYYVTVEVFKNTSANTRTQAIWWCSLFDGDNEACRAIQDSGGNASQNGSGGSEGYTLAPSNDAITFTYTGSDTVSAFVSAKGFGG